MPAQAENRLYQQVADQIARLIEAGRFSVGTRLPRPNATSRRVSA